MFELCLPAGDPAARRIDAMFALARRGLTMLQAKRAIEALLADCVALVDLPTVEDPSAVLADLAQAGIGARQVVIERPPISAIPSLTSG